MLIIPAIDLKNGKCVRLKQGRMYKTTDYGDPLKVVQRFVKIGIKRLHVIDLNGAVLGEPVNKYIINKLIKHYPNLILQIGGGIRNSATIKKYLDVGIKYVIIGTLAIKKPHRLYNLCKKFGKHIILSIDSYKGYVAIDGWKKIANIKSTELAKNVSNCGISSIIYTDISRDGMMQGLNLKKTIKLANFAKIPIIASGGLNNVFDIVNLKTNKNTFILGTIIGRAFYEGKIDLYKALLI
ncbi:1-(5-phosphoribosyl)-5-[(5-phosphoribosylamino)methylideneamino]imidazole-4-carboxamide isomerase [Candidatus Portiera aleyrodidarum]|uniref:1-(5-phosphoribosyl)-5-[(5-phosphoribosylamino)methylideneamino] imidazole-4-carboxamide isomerase n=1 Tax=Candidatus Portiera aleyrodidarum MED (Bemisia tabaci) TaxID=1163752 RepID=A0AAU8SBU3_9GAMM|nr:1-(5-phosphoribosyl)-5-[(5-phosphoribosylamino)methylideneamino]imidazole-4-carboxamide isomerase [Candidatus Portiera aleyrodidarum]AFQ24215.1 1-(5-phosphoribosyl)-5-((5-phosphoribosylamino)methylideneamino) imidazole-4-carboxamide isomerase [Candidatus Portiera aleyrodidarum BT-B-HRs]AFS18971.1 1-(5-phosphoribosyl)-5-[(5-phosphoribosylamino)methylideneamino] imidazole-4-carboxamide isomerase [Candidatus Portiera aleyrodidarum BT-QVLC]AFT80630.1 Phosphoribosylformimino-5-aminoimidazole carbo